MIDLSATEARRVALHAQGFGLPRPTRPTARHMREVASRLGCIQIDAVNVLVRAHYLPLFSRLGPYDTRRFDDLVYKDRAMFEYPGHALSLLPIELYPLLRWRMAAESGNKYRLHSRKAIEAQRPGYHDTVLAEIAERGPLAFTELADPGRREKVKTKYAESSIAWWRWSDGKAALDGLFATGRLAVAARGRGFDARFDLTERVIPAAVLDRPAPASADAQRELVAIAATALGVATVKDIADYYRLSIAQTKIALTELTDANVVEPARVEGWSLPAYIRPGVTAQPVAAAALVSPFDSLVWERARTERLFGFRYRIEIYVPAPKREYGYYVLPFLLGDRLAARVDLKADRQRGVLMVPGAFLERGADARKVVPALRRELAAMASWLGLERVETGVRGDLVSRL